MLSKEECFCKVGSLVCLIPSEDDSPLKSEIFGWYELTRNGKYNLFGCFLEKDTIGIYLGLWKNVGDVNWYKILIGKQEYILHLKQFKPYIEK